MFASMICINSVLSFIFLRVEWINFLFTYILKYHNKSELKIKSHRVDFRNIKPKRWGCVGLPSAKEFMTFLKILQKYNALNIVTKVVIIIIIIMNWVK